MCQYKYILIENAALCAIIIIVLPIIVYVPKNYKKKKIQAVKG